jgi:NADH-quinone oxidoreductase subunit K
MLNLVIFTNPHESTSKELLFTNVIESSQPFPDWLVSAFVVYSTGLLGMIYNHKNFIITMMSVELVYLGVILSFMLCYIVCKDGRGAIYALALLIVAACESAIGLGILIVLYRFGHSIAFSSFEQLGG